MSRGPQGRRRGVANLPLHSGRAPAWLFRRMTEMAGNITSIIVQEYGASEVLTRLSDPHWFQAFGCLLGFDWHSSGVTTTVCGALKEASKKLGSDMGIVVCGGKGKTSRQTPVEISKACEHTGDDAEPLIYASKMSAKIDSSAVQDGYQLYQHTFVFVPGISRECSAQWSVVQQGMNDTSGYARRYHWSSQSLADFTDDPHTAVAAQSKARTLNLVAGESVHNRVRVADMTRLHPDKIMHEVRNLVDDRPLPLFDSLAPPSTSQVPTLSMPRRHSIASEHIAPSQLRKVLIQTYEAGCEDFESVLGLPGLGAKSLRSLALIAELIYSAKVSRRDPASYSFAHGGKDGFPFPVARRVYDENIERLQNALRCSKIGNSEKLKALARLARWIDQQ